MPIITRSVGQTFASEEPEPAPAPAPADTSPDSDQPREADPPPKTFDESTSRGWLDRVTHQLEEFAAVARNPDTPRLDLPTTEHNLGCLVREIDETMLDDTVEWEEVKEVKKKIRKVIADMAPRLWGKGR